ncbi:hypothetical protein ACLVWU_14350 [Bdellovibrio sp. HCB290]|uniref:hypothetical protein n=1 Tax=Bdellovibrio sp. HCB290 TaxID=3394356 RepID=UPI0039B49FB2
MKLLVMAFLISVPMMAQAQTQAQAQKECVTTIRVRSMSISSAEAEKLCAGDYQEVVNCAVTARQSSMGSMDDALKKCRGEMGLKAKEQPEAKKAVTDTPKAGQLPVVVPVDSMAPDVEKTHDGGSKEGKKSDDSFQEL